MGVNGQYVERQPLAVVVMWQRYDFFFWRMKIVTRLHIQHVERAWISNSDVNSHCIVMVWIAAQSLFYVRV